MASSNPKWSISEPPSRSLIGKMKIQQLEDCLKVFGLSTDCGTTKRSEELKKRLRSHLYSEGGDQTSTLNSTSLDFLKYGGVLKRIPKGSRQNAAKVLTQILESLIQKNDTN